MANEITWAIRLSAAKNGATLAAVNDTANPTMTGAEGENGTQVIATSAGAVTIGAVSIASAWMYFKNLDATNFVVFSMASDATTPFAKLTPGDWMVIRGPATGTIYAKADTASVRIIKTVFSA